MNFKGFSWRRRSLRQGQSLPALPLPRLITAQTTSVVVLPIGEQVIEVVSLVPADCLYVEWGAVLDSLASHAITPRWADGKLAGEFGHGQWERLWPTFPSRPEVRLIFPATETADECGFLWVPCIRLTAEGYRISKTWLRQVQTSTTNTMNHGDFAVLRLA